MVTRCWAVSKLKAVRLGGQAYSHNLSNTLLQRQHYGWMGQGGQGTCRTPLIYSLSDAASAANEG